MCVVNPRTPDRETQTTTVPIMVKHGGQSDSQQDGVGDGSTYGMYDGLLGPCVEVRFK